MRTLGLTNGGDRILRILCLGAHADDIEIGCGGTLLRLLEEVEDREVMWVVFSAAGERRAEALASAETFLGRAWQRRVVVHGFRDGYLPHQGASVKESFEEVKASYAPDLIFTHYRHDLHQDHRLVSELTWNTFRDHLILEYEIPKYDGDFGTPNTFVHLSETTCQDKVGSLMSCYRTQQDKRWFTKELFFSLMRLRGMECNAPSCYAEAFYSRKLVL